MLKIALFSDVHGNLPALQVVLDHIDRWQPDLVLVNGDVLNRGPQPRECWELVSDGLDRGWAMTIGNHEQYVIDWDHPKPNLSEVDREMHHSSLWTRGLMSDAQLERVRKLPTSHSFILGGKHARATHGSLKHTRDGIVPWMEDEKIAEKMRPVPDVYITSHTHRIFQRVVNGTLVINTGSVGVPLDGDVRAGYVQLVWDGGDFSAELIRLNYDRAATKRQFELTNYNETNGASAALLQAEWRDARSHVPLFFKKYGDAMRAGEIAPRDAVAEYLSST